MRNVGVGLLLFLVVYLNGNAVSAQSPSVRYTNCDLCGYCEGREAPSTWESCRACLYPGITAGAENKETLRVESETNLPPTPYSGRYYTMIGCLSTNVSGGFSGEGGAGSVVQTLLNILFASSGGVAFIFLLYGAFMFLTSQGDAEKLNQGRRIVTGAIIGVIFVIVSVFIVNLIGCQVLKLPGWCGNGRVVIPPAARVSPTPARPAVSPTPTTVQPSARPSPTPISATFAVATPTPIRTLQPTATSAPPSTGGGGESSGGGSSAYPCHDTVVSCLCADGTYQLEGSDGCVNPTQCYARYAPGCGPP